MDAATVSSDHALELKHKTASNVETHAVKGVRQKEVGDECEEFMKFSVIQKKTAACNCRQHGKEVDMPLKRGSSQKTISSNIGEMVGSFKKKGKIGTSKPSSTRKAVKQAAAIAYGLDKKGAEKNVLIFDLGSFLRP